MTYCVVSNIPKTYRSADLRKHFKQLTENGSFQCFHFRHRPEERPNAQEQEITSKHIQTLCCVVKVAEGACEDLINTFHHKRWTSPVADDSLGVAVIFKTNINDSLLKLPELNPPKKLMPSGNVGTPTKHFLSLVQKCLLPPAIIKKLQLEFPRTVKRKQYTAVPPSCIYQSQGSSNRYSYNDGGPCSSASNIVEGGNKADEENGTSTRPSFWTEKEKEEAHDGAEDWERHESFNNDVGTQERTKERLYEEDMEIVWDKGSSGLVFYTDGNYWADLQGKDTDGLWADEWDVDMGVYEGQVGDKDARDAREMRESDQFKRHGDVTETVGDFEKHTKGFGGRLMRQQGWRAGQGLGKSTEGMSEPVSTEGSQNPKDKSGLGYRGESIVEAIRRNNPRPKRPPVIGTKFDEVVDHRESAVRSEDPTAMKYRRTNK